MLELFGNMLEQNPDAILIWTNGFFTALALRRGRIQNILNRFVPSKEQSEEESDKAGGDKDSGSS